YTVSTADIYGCTNYATVDVIVLPVPAGTISVSSTPGCAPVCAGMLVTSPDSLSIINWDMGDGVIESNANDTIQHCYLADGFYDVTCIITSTNGCQASILYSNAAAVHSSSNINGTVYDEFSAPVTSGNVFLFGYSAVYGAFDTVAVTSLDASGQYSFPGVPANSYLVKCVADPITYPLYIGTYYGNVAYWPVATLINSVCDSTYTADINLSQGALMTGTGVISGYVLEGIGYGQRIANVNHIAAPGGPLKGVCVNLKKVPGGGYQAQTQTDSLGYYEFVNIPTGDYTVEVDIPGLVADSTYSYFLTVDPFAFISGANNNSIMSNAYSGVDFVADSTTIFATNTAIGIKENKNTVSNINVFPNPAKNKINIVAGKTTDEMQIQLFDNIGTLVKKENVKAGESILSVEGTSPGIYLLKVITTNGISTKAVIIQN
ncbi:MAG TPA: T9SS type A sorting domain-containing protein, partial [Bacteroidia bacterium]